MVSKPAMCYKMEEMLSGARNNMFLKEIVKELV
jgi:hypothetical protein